MRRGTLAVAAALLLLTGCHEYWGSQSSGSLDYGPTVTATYDPTLADQQAQTTVRAAIPAIEAWHADHGTYKGMTVVALNSQYDRSIGDGIRLVGPLTKDLYCVESSAGNATWRKAGPAGLVESGSCASTGAAAGPPPPRPSYGDPRTDLRSSVPAIEAWRVDRGKYSGMTTEQLRAEYDYGIPSGISVVRATRKSYCIETTVGGDTWSYIGPRPGFRHAGC
jgi:hypothetical protein